MKRKTFYKVAGFGFFLVVIAIGLVVGDLYTFAHMPGTKNEVVPLSIPPATSGRGVAQILEKAGLISSSHKFYYYARFIAQKTSTLQAGEYLIEGKLSPAEILELLQKGLPKQIRFTIPEGANQYEIANIIEQSGLCKASEIIGAMHSLQFLSELSIDPKIPGGAEGYVFPQTYQLPINSDALTIVRFMHAELKKRLSPEIMIKIQLSGMNLHQILTLASIVEKEASLPEERRLIATVMLNRLKKNMRLQTDPTVRYWFKNLPGRLLKVHLNDPHPYNTYVHGGLPPGPIASPSLEAILAALDPLPTEFLYFVAKKDGSHEFCISYDCHQKAVAKWQLGN